MSIGSDLREARENQGLSLRDISDRTKVRVAVLRAIEEDQFDPAIGAVIMRGFLKIYAREVSLDPADIAHRFEEITRTAGAEDAHARGVADMAQSATRRRRLAAGAGAVAVLVALVGYIAFRPTREATTTTAESGAQTPPSTSAPAGSPSNRPTDAQPAPTAPPSEPVPTPTAPAPEPGALRVDVEAIDACWLAATSDGRQVVFRTLNAGEKLTLEVKEEAVLRIGVPGNLSVRINGQPIRPLPRPATPSTLRITPDAYRDLLVP